MKETKRLYTTYKVKTRSKRNRNIYMKETEKDYRQRIKAKHAQKEAEIYI